MRLGFYFSIFKRLFMKIFLKILIIIVWIYFILSNIAFYDMVMNTKIEFPYWSEMVFLPGCFLGFTIALAGSVLWGFIAQFVVFLFLLLISIWILKSFKTKKINE